MVDQAAGAASLRQSEFRPLRRFLNGLDTPMLATPKNTEKNTEKSHAGGKILQSVNDGVGIITFNNPDKRNAMSLEMWEGLGLALTELRDNADVRVVILTGAGDKAFCAGGDLKEMTELHLTVPPLDMFPVPGDNIRLRKPTIFYMKGIMFTKP